METESKLLADRKLTIWIFIKLFICIMLNINENLEFSTFKTPLLGEYEEFSYEIFINEDRNSFNH